MQWLVVILSKLLHNFMFSMYGIEQHLCCVLQVAISNGARLGIDVSYSI